MEIPEHYQDMYERGRSGSRKAAIRCFCLQCVGWKPSEVRECTATDCPLYTFREKG